MDARISSFLDYRAKGGSSPNTSAAYKNDLDQFASFLRQERTSSLPWDLVSPEMVDGFTRDLRRRGYAKVTLARKVSAISSFFGFLEESGLISYNPLETYKRPDAPKPAPKALSKSEVERLLQQPYKSSSSWALRDRAILEVLYATGMRVTELTSLNLDCIHIKSGRSFITCRGKNNEERTIPINERAARVLSDYLKKTRSKLLRNRGGPALFINLTRGTRLTRQGLWLIIKTYAEAAGIQSPVTPHTLRHSFAIHMLRSGVALITVQELLGHKNISTTQPYAKIIGNRRGEYESAHPRAR